MISDIIIFFPIFWQLHLFTHNTHVNRANVTKATKIPTEEMKAILEQFSIKTDQGWKFKLPVDQSFIDK
jgi:hypothetical protein